MSLSERDLKAALLPPKPGTTWGATWATVSRSSPQLLVVPDGQDEDVPATGLGAYEKGERVWCLLTGDSRTHRRTVTVIGRPEDKTTYTFGDATVSASGVSLSGAAAVPWSSVAAPLMTSYERSQGSSSSARTVSPALLAEAAIPVGAILPYAGATAPSANWSLCDGASLYRPSYPDLYAAIGTAYGSAGASWFNLPDLRAKVPVGYSSTDSRADALGETGGSWTKALSVNEMPAHNHGGSTGSSRVRRYVSGYAGQGDPQQATSTFIGAKEYRTSFDDPYTAHTHSISSSGGGAAFDLAQPYVVLNYIIRTKP